ncbi:MAG: hypothetical protein WCF36_12530 [Candidatus Nanopelagicales bacterium]
MPEHIEPLPADAILLHVGFHKTGTTALQSAFASTRAQLLEAGVLYPGSQRSHHRAAMAVTDRTWGWGDKGGRPPRAKYWDEVVRASRAHPGRVMLSSEALSLARKAHLDRIIADLGADRLHVITTLRPFTRLLSSSYQQYLKYGLTLPYDTWLESAFADPPQCPPSPNFWRRNDHAGVMERWAARLGPHRVRLVVLDESDRNGLFRTFEGLLGLPEGLLVPDPELSASNRSMTAAEAELLRLINVGGASDWDWPAYQDGIRRGAVMRMVESRRPSRDEPGLATPEWAVHAGQAFGRQTADRVAALGIPVHGDLGRLAAPIKAGEAPAELLLPVAAAAEAVLGGVLGTAGTLPGRTDLEAAKQAAAQAGRQAIDELTTRDTAALLRTRLGQARRRRMAKVRAGRRQ